MMNNTLIILFAAITISFIHTLVGPDHYLPLIAIAKTRHWSLTKTFFITLICGVGHVLSAILLGIIAILIGLTIDKLSFIENWRGTFAAWILIGFGAVYLSWSIYSLKRSKHKHQIISNDKKNITIWVLILVFLLGPCEPLIPIMLYAAIQGSIWYVVMISVIFGIVTIITMVTLVIFAVFSTKLIKIPFLEKYGHILAGTVICFSGFAIKWL
jgi:nickel/cobalt transporter (NicO) family protein